MKNYLKHQSNALTLEAAVYDLLTPTTSLLSGEINPTQSLRFSTRSVMNTPCVVAPPLLILAGPAMTKVDIFEYQDH